MPISVTTRNGQVVKAVTPSMAKCSSLRALKLDSPLSRVSG